MTHPNLQIVLNEKIEQLYDKDRRGRALWQGVCPDCTGTVKDITGFWGNFLFHKKYKCLQCGRDHAHNFDCGD